MILAALAALLTSAPIPEQPAYPSQHEAMVAAAHAAITLSGYESGGAIYQSADGFHYTAPVTESSPWKVDYKVSLPRDAKLVALYHTHPNTGDALVFSDSDRALQKQTGVPMYVVAIPYHSVIAIGAESFALDVPARDYSVIDYKGRECLVTGEIGSTHWIMRCGEHNYYAPKSRYTPRIKHEDAT